MKRIIKSKKLIIMSVLIIAMFLGMIWQLVMIGIERKTYTAPGQFVDVETYQAHYYLQGDGDPVFIFITGSGTPCAYTDFYAIQNKLSAIGQTITFDHPGSGWSTETESERSIENIVKELSIIIDKVALNRSVVLISHSLGSLEAIGYAQKYPERVEGIIFLDSGSPEFYSTDSELTAKIVNRSAAFTRVFGINRLLGEVGVFLPMYGENIRNTQLPDNKKDTDKAMYYQYAGNASTLNSIELINENAEKVLKERKLGDIPILVLSSDSGSKWNEVQKQLASWSEQSKQITIEDSNHYLYWSNYDGISDYIDEFINYLYH
ncbi:alpha/beta fold hydrolase [Clostridium paraputrificum]|uniref:alpha/beta fold hydrolase n=1 Tax=Clostridium paraputrificum TaxID=29363 RepID=UPI003D353CC0